MRRGFPVGGRSQCSGRGGCCVDRSVGSLRNTSPRCPRLPPPPLLLQRFPGRMMGSISDAAAVCCVHEWRASPRTYIYIYIYVCVRVRVWPGAPLLQRVCRAASAPVSVVRGEHEGVIRRVCIFKHPRYGNVPPPPVSIYLLQRSWRLHVMAKKKDRRISLR